MSGINLQLVGYDPLGTNGEDGIRYAWKHPSSTYYVESAAFSQHTKTSTDHVCGYTTSVSSGCMLCSMNLSCRFCRTGTQLPYGKQLSAEEIAKQNIFMVLTDIHCSDHPKIRFSQREFAYMGQGEPGFSYAQVREAIEITNSAMKELGQTVFRHIVATSGVPQMAKLFVNDLKTEFFSSRVTMHFSLHGASTRSVIMPINKKYPYQLTLDEISDINTITGEKPCIGILLLKNFKPTNSEITYSMGMAEVRELLHELDPSKFRLSFCEFNGSPDLGCFDTYNQQSSEQILLFAKEAGFEAKLFSSFGKDEITACGMLGGKEPSKGPSSKWMALEREATDIVNAIRANH